MAVETTKVKLLQKLREHITKDPKSLYILVKGDLGSGKSWVSLSLCSGLDPDFVENKEQRIVFNPVEFVVAMANRELPEGSMIMWDEAQTSMNPRKHMTAINVALNTQLDTMRRDNIGLVFNAPHRIDKDIIRKLDFEVETIDIDLGARKNRVKFKEIDHNKDTDKIYKKYIRVSGEKLVPSKLNPLYIPAPDLIREENTKEFIDYYERTRDKFQDIITKGSLKTIVENCEDSLHLSPKDMDIDLSELMEDLEDKEEKKDQEKEELVKDRIRRALKETDLKYKEIAKITGSKESYVKEIGRKVDRS